MLFNSFTFIFGFLPLTFFGYFLLQHYRMGMAATAFLVVASLTFYAWWNPTYLPLILVSILFNYVVGNILGDMARPPAFRQRLLAVGVIANLGLLGYYKYAGFFVENLNIAAGTHFAVPQIVLPLAISFFTFQQIAYLVDSYRGETREYDFLRYTLFVTFFPQLIAGPIVHHAEMMPQFVAVKNRVRRYRNIAAGLFVFSMGLFKKVVLADHFALFASDGFSHTQTLGFLEGWSTSLSYTMQLYFDFSGYTDMAIGAALLFNIRLPYNFNSPYKARDIQDFWRRWHITLSRFLKAYVYIPLGGNRKGRFRTYANLMLTFLLGGIWHGAGWTFLFWGFLHGAALVVHRFWEHVGFRLPRPVAWLITFNFVNVAWIFFRADTFSDALNVLRAMLDFGDVSLSDFDSDIYWQLVLAVIGVVWLKNSVHHLSHMRFDRRHLVWAVAMAVFGILSLNRVSEFIYFNF